MIPIRRGVANKIGLTAEQLSKKTGDQNAVKYPHYFKDVRHLEFIDVYQVFRLWGTTDHEIEHAIKKLLNAGQRGAKNKRKDVQEAIDTLKRYMEITE